MDTTGQVTKWVEKKVDKIISKDLEERIVDENSTFDVETYANNLFVKLLINDDDLRNLKEILNPGPDYDLLYVDSGNSTEDRSAHDSFESESNDLQSFSFGEVVKSLENDSDYQVRIKSLKVLESFVEDLMSQGSWNKIKEILQKMLNKIEDREMMNLILKVFQKPLRCPKKPQIVSKGFTTIVEVLTNQMNLFNTEYNNISFEEVYDIREEEWLCEEAADFVFTAMKNQRSISAEMLIKLMWLLIDCQQQIPAKWVRFNETRFREIIFSFINLLSSTNSSESTKLSGLELLSVLNPKASWCRYWCHTAVGRFLLCSALRKYKVFFIHIIEIILNHMKIKKKNKLPPVRDGVGFSNISPKQGDDVPGESKPFQKNVNKIIDKQNDGKIDRRKYADSDESPENSFSKNTRLIKSKKLSSEWIVENIPKRIVTEAVFFHSVSLVSCLIQFRSGRALFPVQTTTRRRLLSAQDLSFSIIEYLENFDYSEYGNTGIAYTSGFQTEVLEILGILKKVKAHINSSRMSAERQQFSCI